MLNPCYITIYITSTEKKIVIADLKAALTVTNAQHLIKAKFL